MNFIDKSKKLHNVCYEIRGPVMEKAQEMKKAGHNILELNIGNTAPFDFLTPDEILQDILNNAPKVQGYGESRGLYSARKAIMQQTQLVGIKGVDVDDIYLGNGVSELIQMTMNALLNDGDEMLIPMPDYPLWTAATSMAGGNAVHYMCNEDNNWLPDLDDMRKKVTKKTRGILIINPNNPTGAVYPKETLLGIIDIARENNLIVFADEIYDRILYDGAKHISIASLADDILFCTFSGLSKNYRLPGFRSGWLILSGAKKQAKGYIEGLNMLASMRLCPNTMAQYGIQTALGGYQSINDLVAAGGRLHLQREKAYTMLNEIDGISCTKPSGALYLFPKIDTKMYGIKDDEKFIYDLLAKEKILLVQGTGFHWETPDHFRVVFLAPTDKLEFAMTRLKSFLSTYKQH